MTHEANDVVIRTPTGWTYTITCADEPSAVLLMAELRQILDGLPDEPYSLTDTIRDHLRASPNWPRRRSL